MLMLRLGANVCFLLEPHCASFFYFSLGPMCVIFLEPHCLASVSSVPEAAAVGMGPPGMRAESD